MKPPYAPSSRKLDVLVVHSLVQQVDDLGTGTSNGGLQHICLRMHWKAATRYSCCKPALACEQLEEGRRGSMLSKKRTRVRAAL